MVWGGNDGLGMLLRNVAHVDVRFSFRFDIRFREVRLHTIQIVRGWLGLLKFCNNLATMIQYMWEDTARLRA